MRKEEVYPAGFKVYDDNGNLVGYEGDYNGEGFVYKDEDAFLNHPDELCYIPEHAFPENDEEEDFETTPEYTYVPVEKALEIGETHKTIVEQCVDAWGEEYMLTDEQAEYFAKDVFGLAEWACIATYLTENFSIEDCIDFEDIKGTGIFTKFQVEAVMNGMTPKEYADRDLSYSELAQFGEEFENAFIQDKDCPDDWSDKGLGDNALLTYIEERRTGVISGPDEFDCDDKWRKSTKQ
jgi:hypothetical protein